MLPDQPPIGWNRPIGDKLIDSKMLEHPASVWTQDAVVDTLYEHRTKLVISAEVPVHDLYRGKTLAFEFKRTASRLNEMQSADYWRACNI